MSRVLIDTIDVSGLVFANDVDIPQIVSQVDNSIAQTPIIFEMEKTSGFIRDLIGGDTWGTLDRDTLLQLSALARIPLAVYELNYEGTVYNVRFRNEDPPAIVASQGMIRSNVQTTDRYNNITIKLMEVS